MVIPISASSRVVVLPLVQRRVVGFQRQSLIWQSPHFGRLFVSLLLALIVEGSEKGSTRQSSRKLKSFHCCSSMSQMYLTTT